MPASAQTSLPASQPTTVQSAPVAFQPGVWIDWEGRQVQVRGRVVLRSGGLEFLACFAGKEHESIIRLDAAAAHIYMALGLIGLTPGRPPTWDEQAGQYQPPAGDLLDIRLEWQEAGQLRAADPCEWLAEIEYGRTPLSRPWVFAGSRRLPDGTLSSDFTGVGIALVDFPDSLICLSSRHPSSLADLWVEARTDAIPPLATPVKLLLGPARPRRRSVVVDFRGQVLVEGRICSPADLADLIGLERQLDRDYVQIISVVGALRADQLRLSGELEAAGLSPDALRMVRLHAPTSAGTVGHPDAAAERRGPGWSGH